VEAGQITSLVGESGSGKSTVAAAIMGLLAQGCSAQGRIFFDGTDIRGRSERDLRRIRGSRISLITQNPGAYFNPVLSLGYQFEETLAVRAGIKDRRLRQETIFRTLGSVRLDHAKRLLKSYPHQASGGELQRLAIAMALALKPRVLIADEPTSSLDVVSESRIINLLAGLQKDLGLTIIFITHNLDLLNVMVSKVVVLRGGRIVEESDSRRLLDNPRQDYSRELVKAYRFMRV
jgi:ABC-type dipeptide/oligopeptide/nickel transport system ATPase component